MFNFIDLTNGHQKTTSWHCASLGHNEIIVPVGTWFNGGPPQVIRVPDSHKNNSDDIMSIINSNEVKGSHVNNNNKELIKCIKESARIVQE